MAVFIGVEISQWLFTHAPYVVKKNRAAPLESSGSLLSGSKSSLGGGLYDDVREVLERCKRTSQTRGIFCC